MLKRQRPSSPSPLPTSMVGPEIEMTIPRHLKRQKLHAHSPHDPLTSEMQHRPTRSESDGEDEYESENDHPSSQLQSDEYKSANSVLYEVHALNQHRLIFSPSTPPPPPFRHRIPLPDRDIPCAPQKLLQLPALTQQPNISPATASLLDGRASSDLKDESLCVKERYEDVNKLLGSLFLSRRRKLDSVDS